MSVWKRIVMGLAVVAVLAVGGYVLSQPRRGTVEYHKKAYLAAANGSSFSERIQRTARRIMGKAHVFAGISGERLNRMREHQSALIELGFLERREMVLTNLPDMPPVKHLQWSVFSEAADRIPSDRQLFSQFSVSSAEVLTAIAPRQDIAILEDLIRKASAAEAAP